MGKFRLIEFRLRKGNWLATKAAAAALVFQPKYPRRVFGQMTHSLGDRWYVEGYRESKRAAVGSIDLFDALSDERGYVVAQVLDKKRGRIELGAKLLDDFQFAARLA